MAVERMFLEERDDNIHNILVGIDCVAVTLRVIGASFRLKIHSSTTKSIANFVQNFLIALLNFNKKIQLHQCAAFLVEWRLD